MCKPKIVTAPAPQAAVVEAAEERMPAAAAPSASETVTDFKSAGRTGTTGVDNTTSKARKKGVDMLRVGLNVPVNGAGVNVP